MSVRDPITALDLMAAVSAAGAAFSIPCLAAWTVQGLICLCVSPRSLLPNMYSPISLPCGSGLSFNSTYQILRVWGFCRWPGLLPRDLGEVTFLPPLGLRNLLWEMRGQTIGPER